MGYVSTTTAFDSSVSSEYPSKNYFESSLLRVLSDSKYSYISFARPFNPRSSVIKAELVLHSAGDYSNNTRKVTVKRQGQRDALYKNLTFSNRPAAHSDGVSVTKTTGFGGGESWVFDVTAHVQRWSDGADFDGWEISTTHTGEIKFYSTDTTASWAKKLEPQLRVWVADEPDPPQDLSPSGNRVVSEPKPVLRWSQLDVNGDTNIIAARVQFDNVASFVTPVFDSGEQPIDDASLNLDSLSGGVVFPGLPADGSSRFWRVMVKDGAGLWSQWSSPVSVRYLPKGVLALTAPALSSPTISDPTPPFSWTLTGATQRAYRLEIFRKHASLNLWAEAWDSGKRTASTSTVTPPKGVLAFDDRLYRVRLVVWDTKDRQTTPGATAAYVIEREFYFDKDAATNPTATISVRQPVWPYPFVEVRWTNTFLPDRTIISRDGVIVADVEAADLADLRQGDGSYLWVDRAPVPGRPNRYTVRPFSGGKMGWGNPSASLTPDVIGRWLITDDFEVFIAGTEQDLKLEEVAGVHEPIGDKGPVRIVTGLKGWSGPVAGRLVRTQTASALDEVSAATWRDRLMRIKRDQLKATFVAGDISVPVTIGNVSAPPTAAPRDPRGELVYDCSLELWERGTHDWEAYG
ncbi:DNRLRE domain-containing protein [Janibacter sp. GS2]|uniref:DNRLRE domain-containing protein n=1 Tax=Janibacter sp. GS2 TaxID=3442646 RepID=UPI003EB87BF6